MCRRGCIDIDPDVQTYKPMHPIDATFIASVLLALALTFGGAFIAIKGIVNPLILGTQKTKQHTIAVKETPLPKEISGSNYSLLNLIVANHPELQPFVSSCFEDGIICDHEYDVIMKMSEDILLKTSKTKLSNKLGKSYLIEDIR